MTAKRYFVTCEVGDCICELISRKLSDDEFEHLTYQDITDRLNELAEENEQLKETIETQNFNYENAKGIIHSSEHQIQQLQDENEQLQERNDRQAKQLDRLYRLIEEKDWRTLLDILDDFKRCEEQLQREWRIYE